MWDENRLAQLLEEKKQHFLEYEQITGDMLACDSDSLEGHMDRRVRLIQQIDKLNAEIGRLCAAADAAEIAPLAQAVRAEGARGAFPANMQRLFDQAIEIRAVLCRIPDLDQQLEMRLEQERETLLELIKAANRGPGAQAARYYGGMGRQQGAPGFQFGKA